MPDEKNKEQDPPSRSVLAAIKALGNKVVLIKNDILYVLPFITVSRVNMRT